MRWFQKTIILFFLFLLFFSACTHTLSSTSLKKMDPQLRQRIQSDLHTPIRFSGIAYSRITIHEKNQMIQLGIDVRTVINDLFTASGTREQIIRLSHKKWIKKLQLAKKVRLLEE